MEILFEIEYADSVRLVCTSGETLLEVARRGGIAIDAPCSGNGTCGKCKVKLLEGAAESAPSRHISPEDYAAGWRLACQTKAVGDCRVFVPASAGAFRWDIRTAHGLLRETEQTLRKAGIPWENRGVAGVGCALDIGTTTVSGVLTNLETGEILAGASLGNGQIPYGADVIHRIIAQSRPGGEAALQQAITEKTLVPLIAGLCRDAGIGPETIARIVVAANTTMNHLLLGEDANTIRIEPYIPAFLYRESVPAATLGLTGNPKAPVLLAPNVGAYVGGDITAGVLANGMWNSDALTLFVDLGTNGELVLGNREFLLACACSAGPAFEGGDISCGMRATCGAVEHITLDPDTLEPTMQVIGGGKPLGICGSGIIDLVAELFRHKVIDPKGRFRRDNPRIGQDAHGVGRYALAEGVFITEVDMDNFIRAKAAIYSGIETLLSSVDMTQDGVERVLIAGGIGSGIDIANAISIGMLPNICREKYGYIGNSSLAGAYAMTMSDGAVAKCRELAESMTYLELSTDPGYMDRFVAACFLPNTRQELFGFL